MKLGSQTNSLINHVLSRAVKGQPEPVEGMGATILAWTDRYPGTITKVHKGKSRTIVLVRQDKATRVDSNGLSESQEYTFEPDPNGSLYAFRQSKNGTWEQVTLNRVTGRYNLSRGYGLRIGERSKYHDFSF